MLFKKESLETLGSRVKMAIHLRGKSPADIERETGVAKSYISRVINNKIPNPKKFVKTISEHLLISENWLVNGVGSIDLDPENNIHIYDVSEGVYNGVVTVLSRNGRIDNSFKIWKGFTHSPFKKDSIIITTSNFDNIDGEYLIKNGSTYHIAIRINDEYTSRWFFKKDLTKIERIQDYDVVGMIIFSLINDKIKAIEIM
ncbi:helix-turn-helix domain-containing protein [Vibrio parahaemolyticus]|uniref:helix-turn-helix domain-containing protein n=1 Tax=Vibrio parahaemolyticus TaxID=670 RepID=UPI00215220C2|nr:helix-turn-helix transcriptional regulator [Vibrio parahaemolyticus]MDF4270080.1 helix-turn-helix transcriptional regulator [Vibrio parahaemolyticus]MDF4275452.1 helix-turn-helix transcriptional regulator [Vibrio parahaemolyticus]MDF4300017.1 helix-turn-helix transcriptional regulator [Vibrio parahaemolyticus]